MGFNEFQRQFYAVFSAIQTSLEQFPVKMQEGVPADWSETIARVRPVAESLILCLDAEKVVAELRKDQTILLIVSWMLTEIDDATIISILQNAYADTPLTSSSLPGKAFAAVLIEVCDNWKPPKKKDK